MADLARIKGNVAKMASMNAPEQDIDGYIASEGVSVDDVKGFQLPLEQEGFVGSVKSDYTDRLKNGEKIAEEYVAGNQSYPETVAQFAGQGAAFGSDLLIEGLKSTARGVSNITPDFIEEPIKRGVKSGLDYASNTSVGRATSKGADYAIQKYGDFAEKFPRAARNVEAATNIGLSVAPSIGVGGKSAASATESLAKKALGGAVDAVEEIGSKLNTRKIYPTSDEVRAESRNLFNQAKELGATFDPKVIDHVAAVGDELLPKGNVAKSLIRPDEADKFIKSFKKVGYRNLTLDDFESLDRHLGEKAHGLFLADPALSRKYSTLQGALRESVENPSNIIGSEEGIKAQREATRLWSISAKMNDVERVIKDAQYYEVPSTAIKTGFRRIARNDKLMRGYTAAERKAIERAAKSGGLDGVFKTFGSRLMAIGGASVGGVPGAIAGYGISESGRGIAEAMKKGQAGIIAKKLGERSGLVHNEKRISTEKDALIKALNKK